MVRISSTASYFMPLFSSNKPSVVVLATILASSIFAMAYLSSTLLLNKYDDPTMFAPNSQDYFRTFLLGFFSPYLLFFLKMFLLNINPSQRFLNLFVDFPINDTFFLLILIGLAYPQIQDGHGHVLNNEPDGDDASALQWHIIPRQSYIFGISWSLSEFIICVIQNIFQYQEVSLATQSLEKNNMDTFKSDPQNSTLNRHNITLSSCMGVRRKSSSISNNIYSSEIDASNMKKNYGTITTMDHHSWDKFKKRHIYHHDVFSNEGNSMDKKDNDDTLILVDPKDNSLRITSLSREGDKFDRNEESEPIFKDKRGFTWVRWRNKSFNDIDNNIISEAPSGINASTHAENIIDKITAHEQKAYFTLPELNKLGKNFMILSIVLISNLWMTIGQALLMSIYFIYVLGHEDLFSDVVIFFGDKDFLYFLSLVFIPYTTLNFFVSTFIYLQDTLVEWFIDPYLNSTATSIPGGRKYSSYLNMENSILFPKTNTNKPPNSRLNQDLSASYDSSSLLESSMLYGSHFVGEDYEGIEPKPIRIAKLIIGKWKVISASDHFVLTAMFLWGLTVFVTGLLTTIPFDFVNL